MRLGGRRLGQFGGVLALVAALTLATSPAAMRPRAVREDPVDTVGPLDVTAAALGQAGRFLDLRVRTAGRWGVAALYPAPASEGNGTRKSLCFAFERGPTDDQTVLCLGDAEKPRSRASYLLMAASGRVLAARTVRIRLSRPGPRTVEVKVLPGRLGLTPRSYGWRVLSAWPASPCPKKRNTGSADPCADVAPDAGTYGFRLRPVRAVGCEHQATADYYRHGPRDHKIVALTFDDGPSDYTPQVLRVLERFQAKATFFELGGEVPGREGTIREVLAAGNEIGNHSTSHRAYPSLGDLETTTGRILRATGFRPCLFRPPYGAVNAALIKDARSAGMSTINWDVDPRDWSLPGSSAIASRVLGAVRPGSIVILHDGGGDRSETVAALPRIIEVLRGRGFRFATVSDLIGDRTIFRPYG